MEGHYVAYTFFRVDPAWRRLPVEERQAHKDAFAEVVEHFAERFEHLRAYSTAGVRPDSDFFLWKITERYDLLEELGAALNATPLAGWLETTYSYLATTKASQYTSARQHQPVQEVHQDPEADRQGARGRLPADRNRPLVQGQRRRQPGPGKSRADPGVQLG